MLLDITLPGASAPAKYWKKRSGRGTQQTLRAITRPNYASKIGRQKRRHLPNITEIAPDVFRISVFVPEINLEFSHFLVRDDEPLLFHAGLRGMFPALREHV